MTVTWNAASPQSVAGETSTCVATEAARDVVLRGTKCVIAGQVIFDNDEMRIRPPQLFAGEGRDAALHQQLMHQSTVVMPDSILMTPA